MLTIELNQTGEHMPDHMVNDYVLYVIDKYNEGRVKKVSVSCELIIHVFRAFVVEGVISCEDIQFLFKGDIIPVNVFGQIENWPNGFCNHYLKTMLRIVDRPSEDLVI